MNRAGCWLFWSALTLLTPIALGEESAARLAPLHAVSFGASETGLPVNAWAIAQAPEGGAIFAGTADGLLEFDGLRWRPLVPQANLAWVRALLPDSEGRLWVGASTEPGYIETEEEFGRARFVSLRAYLPPNRGAATAIRNIHRAGDHVLFVAEQEILVWDGKDFVIHALPTADRLRSFVFEGEVWVHHLETGLRRWTGSGFTLVHEANTLAPSPILTLVRLPAGVGAVSRVGVHLVGDPARQLTSEATVQLFREYLATSATPWGADRLAVGTLGGLLILTRELKLERILSPEDGLPSPAVHRVSVDQEGNLWACTLAGFLRLGAAEGAVKVNLQDRGASAAVDALASREDGTLLIASAGRLLALAPSAMRSDTPARLVSRHDRLITALHASGHSVLVGRHGSIEWVDPTGTHAAGTIPNQSIFGFVPLRTRPGHFVVQHLQGVSLLAPDPTKGWRVDSLARMVGWPMSAAEDRRGRLWVGTQQGELLRLDLGDGSLTRISTLSPSAGGSPRGLRLTGDGDLIFAGLGERLMRVDPETSSIESVEGAPPVKIRLLQLAPHRRRLYIAFDRPAEAPARHGLGVLELDAAGRASGWRDLATATLAQVGTPSALHVTATGGHETIWLGGSEGLLRIAPEELSSWPEPRRPRLTVSGEGRLNARPTFAYKGHRLTIEVHPMENATRSLLSVETRFGDDGVWTPAEGQTRFTFSRLDEGTYTFAARLRNPAGQAGPAAELEFRIAPPWYRTAWAYAGSLGITLATIAAGVVWRERRNRTRRSELERQVRERTAALAQANAIKDDFLASLSHEIRNPLNGVVGLCATIDPSPLNQVERHRFGLLRQCAEHLASLLEEILDLARLQSGYIELRPHTFAPAELLASVRAIASASPAGAGVEIRTSVDADVPAYVVGDRRRLQQVLLNFTTNAIKYARGSPIELKASARRSGAEAVELTLTVSDEGPGIAAKDQARLFAKFERGAAARRDQIPGTGLGLAVCRQLAGAMGGRVGVESAPGQGAAFFLRLPLLVGRRPPLTASALAPDAMLGAGAALAVDDEDYNRAALGALLSSLGFAATTAPDAEAALSLVAEGRTFAVVLLDYDLPGMKGPALARRLRELAPEDDQPVILATTAYATVEKRGECLEAGMDGFVGKPVTPARLRHAVAEALAVRRSGRAQGAKESVEGAPRRHAPDPLDNLRLLAASRRHSVAEEFATFAADCIADFAAWREAAARRDQRQAAKTAHHLAGRFGFVRAGTAAALALELENASAEGRWGVAAEILDSVEAEWKRQEILLRSRAIAPAELAHS